MAATIAVLGSALTTTAGNKTVTATPTNGDLIVVVAVATGVASTVSDNGTGGTYTQVGSTQTGFSTTGNLQIFVRNALVTGAASTVYTATQTSSTGGGLVVLRVTGMTLTGASAVRSSGGQSTVAAGTPAPVLSLTPLSSNPIITAMANSTSTSTTNVVQRTGYTEDFDNGYNTPPTGLEVSHLASGETSATLTYGGATGSTFASIAIELQFNSAPTTALNTPADTATGISTTPTLNFTGTDADSDAVEYNVQVASDSSFSQTLDQQNTFDFSTSNLIGFNASNDTLGQSFTAGVTGNLNGISLYLNKVGTRTDNLTIEVLSGSITGSIVGTSLPVNGGNISTTLNWVDFVFPSSISITNGVKYYFRVNYSGAFDASNYYQWELSDSANRYANGGRYFYINGAWGVESTTFDLMFKTYTGSTTFSVNSFSTADAGFTAGHPFASGVAKDFTVQAGDTLANNTLYYWRVRAIDPSGTNTYGAYATTRSFTTTAGVAAIPNKIYSSLQAVNRSNTY